MKLIDDVFEVSTDDGILMSESFSLKNGKSLACEYSFIPTELNSHRIKVYGGCTSVLNDKYL